MGVARVDNRIEGDDTIVMLPATSRAEERRYRGPDLRLKLVLEGLLARIAGMAAEVLHLDEVRDFAVEDSDKVDGPSSMRSHHARDIGRVPVPTEELRPSVPEI